MGTHAKHIRSRNLHVRLDDQEAAALDKKVKAALLHPHRDTSRFIRALLRNDDTLPVLRDDQLEELRHHFADLARVGGLINQIAYHLNAQRLALTNGGDGNITLDAADLAKKLRDLQSEVTATKKAVLKLCNHRMA